MVFVVRAEFVVETLKLNAVPTTHEELDEVLAAFMHDDFGKVKVHAPHPHAHPTSPPSPPTFTPPPPPSSRPSTHLTYLPPHHTMCGAAED